MIAMPGWAILEVSEKKMEGVIELPDSAKGEIQQGVIIEINTKMFKEGEVIDFSEELAKGDKVAFKKYHDQALEIDGKKYKAVELDKIICKL